MAGGQSFTSAAGQFGRVVTLALVGAAISAGQGLVTPNNVGSVPLAGSAIAVTAGDAHSDYSRAPTGNQIDAAAGTLILTNAPPQLTGQVLVGSLGTLSAQGDGVTANISGAEATFSSGILTGGTQFLNSQASTGFQGSVSLDLSFSLTGAQITTQSGVVSPAQDAVDTLITSSSGSTSASLTLAVAGSEAVTAQGSVSITGDAFAALTGIDLTSGQGALGFEESYLLSGLGITTAQYNVGAPGGATLAGSAAVVVDGNLFTTNDREFALTGVVCAVQDGLLFSSPLAFVIGQALSSDTGLIGPRTLALSGAGVSSQTGSIRTQSTEAFGAGGGFWFPTPPPKRGRYRFKDEEDEDRNKEITPTREIVQEETKAENPKRIRGTISVIGRDDDPTERALRRAKKKRKKDEEDLLLL